jgi:hypothetical protein
MSHGCLFLPSLGTHFGVVASYFNREQQCQFLMLGYMQTRYHDACGISCIDITATRTVVVRLTSFVVESQIRKGVVATDAAGDLAEPIAPISPPHLAQAVLLESQ